MDFRGAQRERILVLLAERGGVTEANVRAISKETGVAEADIWGAGNFYGLLRQDGPKTLVCDGLTCMALGAEARKADLERAGHDCAPSSCLGLCDVAPAAIGPDLAPLAQDDRPCHLTPDDPELPINLAGPRSSAYAAFARAKELGPDGVIAAIAESGLQGRGGAGFAAHIKWKGVRGQAETVRYVVCNADEGEPGTFKDREVIRRQPEKMVEGLAIAAWATGARDIYIYLRAEFERERRILVDTIAKATAGPLGGLVFHMVRGHGAYICGEETALLESLEGKRGMPRLKPPFPTERGFRGKPTLIHNVETIACVPDIVLRGGARFRAGGRQEAGAKLYCISGHVVNPGIYELPLGVSLDELVQAAGGYVGTPLVFSPGGASSGFLPMSERGRPLDFANLAAVGSMLGSAGAVVLNDTVDLAQAVRWQLHFFEHESCGQCAPCRIGTRWIHGAMQQYLQGGDPAALGDVADVAWEMGEGSICGLGQIAALPLTSAMQHFPDRFGPREPGSAGHP